MSKPAVRRTAIGMFLVAAVLIGAAIGWKAARSSARQATGSKAIVYSADPLGTLRYEGPPQFEVDSFQTFTLCYTAGREGIAPGGGIRIAVRHLPRWTYPQAKDPAAEGYLSVGAPDGVKTAVSIEYDVYSSDFFPHYFPWQNIVEVKLPDKGLSPGQTLRVTYGDRSGGGPGIRVQPFDEKQFVFKSFADTRGNGDYLPLATEPAIEIVAAAPQRLNLVMPSQAVVGQPTWCIVRAEDRYGNPAVTYRGEVRITATGSEADLPESVTFRPVHGGVYHVANVVFHHPGIYTLQASDGQFQATGNPVRVCDQPPEELLLWGDIHGHTLDSDGRGTVEQYYDFARNFSGLDFCAVTDHAFEILDSMWVHSKQVTNHYNESGRFVTFPAYEWSGDTPDGGDHNVYFVDPDPPLYRSTVYYDPRNLQMAHNQHGKVAQVDELFEILKGQLEDKNLICIPHLGGRRGNPEYHDPTVQRVIEIFSEHQRSHDWAMTFLGAGQRLGIIASSDGHYGNPGYGYLYYFPEEGSRDPREIGMGLVAVYTPQHTRRGIIRALYDRRVYATSGERILLDFHVDGRPMGSEITAENAPAIEVNAVGTAPLDRVEVHKNDQVIHTIKPGTPQAELRWSDPEFDASKPCFYWINVFQVDGEEAVSSPVWVN